MSGASERGFSLLEVLIACALTVAVIFATGSAVANALHGSALAAEKMSLTDDALAVLNDVRAVVSYDTVNGPNPTKLHRLIGHSSSMTLVRAGRAENIVVSIEAVPGSTAALAQATVNEGGIGVTERQTISVEAPAPGSSVEQP